MSELAKNPGQAVTPESEFAYSSLEQRAAQYYVATFPGFIPDEKGPVSVAEQREFYDLMRSLYQLACVEPSLFVTTLHEDAAVYEKQVRRGHIVRFMKSIDALLEIMFTMGQGESVKFSKKQLGVLARLQVSMDAQLPPAWRWMSTRSEASITAFARCFFKNDHSYTTDIYADMFGDELAFRRLDRWMIEHGYVSQTLLDVAGSDCKLALNYYNPTWDKKPPTGTGPIRQTGMTAIYDPRRKPPYVFWMEVPNILRGCLGQFAAMSKQLQDFVITHIKKCDGCRYCVQTDKSGKRPLICTKIQYGQEEHVLCPLFPSGSYRWHCIDDALADRLIELLEFMDNLLPKKEKRV